MAVAQRFFDIGELTNKAAGKDDKHIYESKLVTYIKNIQVRINGLKKDLDANQAALDKTLAEIDHCSTIEDVKTLCRNFGL